MDIGTIAIQLLNGLQYGLLLFLIAAGLTLIFGILGVINLAHGSFYMIGAYLAYWLSEKTGSFALAIALALPAALLLGLVVERLAISFLYQRDHLYQVLLTYGLILIFNELQRIVWGNDVHGVAVPAILAGVVEITESQSYPVYRLFISAICLLVAAAMYVAIHSTRIGMMIRAGSSSREMVQILGIDVGRLFAIVFSVGAALTAVAGMLAAPINSVYPGMGENVLIISFVVVVIGGIGSIKGAFIGSMMIGLADTFGRVMVPELSSMVVYALMAAVLLWRPSGLYGVKA
ncbi:branched-chain amino acid ABC transporter permease [Bradyrhizobium sp.]|uniref:branched-chain amino acid ABC transporter permease n=1 Tax=Bradyrhizobium sp. TaxID=376 RepID=UPI0023877636|nr:branched-chain amino acid ABC transporter permease [Bradyrhizobium sp.]MDE2376060.1 branched-chain amino acid ABC transporter permease [Bradyrhizobium sp.]